MDSGEMRCFDVIGSQII